jgi:hypothetical protein
MAKRDFLSVAPAKKLRASALAEILRGRHPGESLIPSPSWRTISRGRHPGENRKCRHPGENPKCRHPGESLTRASSPRKAYRVVIPAKAGIHVAFALAVALLSAFPSRRRKEQSRSARLPAAGLLLLLAQEK